MTKEEFYELETGALVELNDEIYVVGIAEYTKTEGHYETIEEQNEPYNGLWDIRSWLAGEGPSHLVVFDGDDYPEELFNDPTWSVAEGQKIEDLYGTIK